MTPKTIFKACAVCVLAGAVAICLWKVRPGPVSATFLGYHENSQTCEAVVALTNHSWRPLRCEGMVTCSRLDMRTTIEVGRPVNVLLGSGSGTVFTVTVPFGAGPARVSCSVHAAGQHSGLTRHVGAQLENLGIYVYHAPPPGSATSNTFSGRPLRQLAYASGELTTLRGQIGGKKPRASLSDWLLFHSYTNLWVVR